MPAAQMTNVEKIADSVWLRLLARGSMIAVPPALTLIVYLGGYWLDARLRDQVKATVHQTTSELSADIDEGRKAQQQLADRVLTLENNTNRGRIDRERFQELTTRQLEGINSSVSMLNATMAAFRATMEAQQRQIDRNGKQ